MRRTIYHSATQFSPPEPKLSFFNLLSPSPSSQKSSRGQAVFHLNDPTEWKQMRVSDRTVIWNHWDLCIEWRNIIVASKMNGGWGDSNPILRKHHLICYPVMKITFHSMKFKNYFTLFAYIIWITYCYKILTYNWNVTINKWQYFSRNKVRFIWRVWL